jgi:hypothetical protein
VTILAVAEQDVSVSWTRYEGRAIASATLTDAARDAELEGYIRLSNPHLTDVRVERATAADDDDTHIPPSARWYHVTYLADDGQGHTAASPEPHLE